MFISALLFHTFDQATMDQEKLHEQFIDVYPLFRIKYRTN